MPKRRILVTGACGKIAGQILPALRERYSLTLLDVRSTDRCGTPMRDVETVDLLNKDREGYRRFFQGMDAVVHLAFVGSSDLAAGVDADRRFWDEFANVQMAYNVYQTSLEEGVRQVVAASSNHTADFYEPLILDGAKEFLRPEDRALSDNYYGWAKETYEHLGFVFATGRQSVRRSPALAGSSDPGQVLEVVQIRIGAPRETDVADCPSGDLRRVRRALGAYISERDMQQLFTKSIEAEDMRNENGIPFQIFYGISNNSHAFWSIANACEVVGYEPEDNSEIRFADLIARHSEAAEKAGSDPRAFGKYILNGRRKATG